MKTTLIAALMLVTLPAMAEEYVSTDVKCAAISTLAESIMTARQRGIAMSHVMEITGRSEPWLSEMARPMVVSAYEKNRYSSPGVQRQEVEDFRDEWHLMCLKASRG